MPDNRNRKRPIQVKFFVDEKELSLIKARMAQLEHSKMMLRDENCPLSRIAEECGFCSDAAFCNFFKKQTGMTPVRYRNGKSGK